MHLVEVVDVVVIWVACFQHQGVSWLFLAFLAHHNSPGFWTFAPDIDDLGRVHGGLQWVELHRHHGTTGIVFQASFTVGGLTSSPRWL